MSMTELSAAERTAFVVQGVLDAVAHGLGDDSERLGAQRAADGIAAQRQNQAGALTPPDAQVENLVKAAGAVGELPFVDDKPCLKVAGQIRRDDLIEGQLTYSSSGLYK